MKSITDFFPTKDGKKRPLGNSAGEAGTSKRAATVAASSASEGRTPLSETANIFQPNSGKLKVGGSEPPKQLTDAQLEEICERNVGIAELRVEQAKARGGQPKLEDLLIEDSWRERLGPEFKKPYMAKLQDFLHKEWANQKIYPPKHLVFRAMNGTPFDQVRVVIIGQDPYPNEGQAMGLSFSVPAGIPVPSSLQNIYKELKEDCGCTRPGHGDLTKWSYQGVLLLNAALTVRAREANAHAKAGWHEFTNAAIRALSAERRGVVFLLWGRNAQAAEPLIAAGRHHVLKSAHPSGLSAHKGFFGCRHFSKANQLLKKEGLPPIDWQIPPLQ